MHPGQLVLTAQTAAQLITNLLPGTDPRSIRLLETSATTSTVVRIGADLAARFPLEPSDPEAARRTLAAEHEAMAEFAALSSLPAPEPVALGESSAAFPMPWSVQTWVSGEVADPQVIAGSDAAAEDLATLLLTLRAAPTGGRRFTGPGRGGELTAGGRLVGVLDTGGYGPADPALDLVGAWHLLDAPRRQRLRERLGSSDLEWERGAAWAFVQAIGLVWYYEHSNPAMAAVGRSTCQRLLEDVPAAGGA